VAGAAVRERKSDAASGWHPSHARHGAIRQQICLYRVKGLTASGSRDELRIERAQWQIVYFVEDSPSRFNPVRLSFEFFRVDQWFRAVSLPLRRASW
jgi:hypothetical protein